MPRPHSFPRQCLVALLLCIVSRSAMAGSKAPIDATTMHLSVESPVRAAGGPSVGSGPYSYRFVVRSVRRVDQPHRLAPYRVILQDDSHFADGRQVFHGRTDALGRTAVFRMPTPVSLADWDVTPAEGRGGFGKAFQLKDETGAPSVNTAYMVDLHAGPIGCGRSLPGGVTAYYQSPRRDTSTIYVNDDSDSLASCLALQRRVNPVMARATHVGRIRGLQWLLKDSRLEDERAILQAKKEALIVRDGSLKELRQLLAHRLAALPQNDPEGRALVLSDLAQQLLYTEPPREVAYADELLDQSLALNTHPEIIDTKGWALHLMGRDAEALVWFDKSLSMYGASCTEAEQLAYAKTLAHRGVALWGLKQWREALSVWAQFNQLPNKEEWAVGMPPWTKIEPIIQATSAAQSVGDAQAVCRDQANPPLDESSNQGE